MSGSDGISVVKVGFSSHTLTAGVSAEIDLEGGTLAGVLLEGDITSTNFTITVARRSTADGGTFVTVKDPIAAGAAVTYTVGATATGFFPISPQTTAGFQFCKIAFDQSETPTIFVAKRSME